MMTQHIKSKIASVITWTLSSFGLIILVLIYAFIFDKGASGFNKELIFGNYWNESSYVAPTSKPVGEFTRPDSLDSSVEFSSKWGIGLVDYTNAKGEELVLVEYIDKNSPFNTVVNPYENNADSEIEIGMNLEKYTYLVGDKTLTGGSSKKESASQIVTNLEKTDEVLEMYVQVAGGGIRGSIVTTLLTIFLSIIISIPFSIAAAIYLNEYSSKNKFVNLIRSGIELLAGVPSIIFGLVGVVMFYPIALMFGATGNTILLGSLTMVIVIFPVAIRSTEETLKVIPVSLREASLSLGATKTQTIFKVVIPSALSGIITAVLLSIGRVISESAALIYTMGTVVTDNPKITSTGTTLAVHIWKEMSGEQPNIELACTISIVILIIVLFLNIGVKLITNKINRKYS